MIIGLIHDAVSIISLGWHHRDSQSNVANN